MQRTLVMLDGKMKSLGVGTPSDKPCSHQSPLSLCPQSLFFYRDMCVEYMCKCICVRMFACGLMGVVVHAHRCTCV